MSTFTAPQDFLRDIGTGFNEGEPTFYEDGIHYGREESSTAARRLFSDPPVAHSPVTTHFDTQNDSVYSAIAQSIRPDILLPTSNLSSAPASSSHLDPSAPPFSPRTPTNTQPRRLPFESLRTQFASLQHDAVLGGDATAMTSPFNNAGGYAWQDQAQSFTTSISPTSNSNWSSSAYGGYQQEQRDHRHSPNAMSPFVLGSPFNTHATSLHQVQQGLGPIPSSRALQTQQQEPYYPGHRFQTQPLSPGSISAAQATRMSLTSAPASASHRQLSPSSTSTKSSKYPCPNCKKSFPYPSALAHHERNHNQDGRIHQCIACNVSFLFLKDLKRHNGTKKHRNKVEACPDFTESTGSEPGPRRFCPMTGCKANRANADSADAGFSRKDHLLRHFKKQHPQYHLDNVDEEMSYSPASM